MKNICVLSNCAVYNDGRVKKMIKTYTRFGNVDFFYINGTPKDKDLFEGKVNMYSVSMPQKKGLFHRFGQSIFFYNNFMFYYDYVRSLNKKYDIVVANDLPTLKPASKIASLNTNCKLIYDSHEIFLATLNQFYPKDAHFIKTFLFNILIFVSQKLGKQVEKKYIKKTDFFITVNESIALFFQKEYHVKKVYSIKNCPEKISYNREELINIRQQYQLNNDEVLFLYQGVINYGRALDIFINAFAKAPSNYHFFIIGYGHLKEDLEKLVRQLGIDNRVHFLGLIPHHQLHLYTPSFDFGVNMGGGNLSKDFGLSNKLFEYMHAGIPVLCTRNPENELIFNKYNIGYLTDNSIEDVLKGILHLGKKIEHSTYVAQCKNAAQEYEWSSEINKLELFLKSLD